MHAADSERRARDAASAAYREATEASRRTLETVAELERQLNELRRGVGADADSLRAVLGRSRSRAGPAVEARPVDVFETTATPHEAELRPALESGVSEPSGASDQVDEARPASEAAGKVAPDAASSAPPDPERAEQKPFLELEAQAQDRARASTDLELAELYTMSQMVEQEHGTATNARQAAYWRALRQAALNEAASRSGFGEVESGADLSRRERREHKQQLKPLRDAVEALGRPSP